MQTIYEGTTFDFPIEKTISVDDLGNVVMITVVSEDIDGEELGTRDVVFLPKAMISAVAAALLIAQEG